MPDATLNGTYVLICDWHGRIVWRSGKQPRLKQGDFAWEHLEGDDRRRAQDAIARVVTLREEVMLDVCNKYGEHYRVWLWPLHSPEVAVCVLSVEIPSEISRLTDREREILGLLAQGLTTREMSQRLDVSLSTIHTHLRRCRKKLSLPSVESLAGFAARYCHPTEAPLSSLNQGT